MLTLAAALTACTLSYAIDGDTVVCTLPTGEHQHVRLTGYDTPELHAHCLEERVRAVAAWRRLSAIIKSRATITLTITSNDCRYGRLCGTLTADNINVGDILISEGLARPYVCQTYPSGRTHCPKREPWCPTP